MEFLPDGEVCPHAFDEASFRVPRHTDRVGYTECAYCCQTNEHPGGIFVCAKCFVGCCPAHVEKHISNENGTHATFVRLEITPKYPEVEPKITEIAQLGAETPKDQRVRCYCGECGVNFSLGADFQIAASSAATAIVNAGAPTPDAPANQQAMWGLDPPCKHCNGTLVQNPHSVFGSSGSVDADGKTKRAPTEKEKCDNCDVAKNCWFCLTCGAVGCPRKEAGGQQHGILHFMMTGHPLVVKLGTITPARADVHCYACEKEIGFYPELEKHLGTYGIQMKSAVKTAKSLAEMELDQSQKREYDTITEEGSKLVPVYGPALTGLNNFGNTCYIASCLQVLLATPPFAGRFVNGGHIEKCTSKKPMDCLECQVERLMTGMASGKYSIPPPAAVAKDDATPSSSQQRSDDNTSNSNNGGGGENYRERRLREDRNSIAPKLWKQVVAGSNAEWKSMQQQDAEEYFQHVMNLLASSVSFSSSAGGGSDAAAASPSTKNPCKSFEFLEENRRSCSNCSAARYSYNKSQALCLNLQGVVEPPPPFDPNVKLTDEELEARRVYVDFDMMAKHFLGEKRFDATCSHCKQKATLTETTRLATFPDFIAIKARREFYDTKLNAIRKMDAKVVMPTTEPLNLTPFVGKGFQPDSEQWLSQEVSSSSSGAGAGGAPAAAQQQNNAAAASSSASGVVKVDMNMVATLAAMDFPEQRVTWALFKTKNDPDMAIGYMFEHEDEPSEADLKTLEETQKEEKKPEAVTQSAASAAPPSADTPPTDKPVFAPKNEVGSDGSPSQYQLYAMVSHMGPNAHSGHWIAHVKHPKHGWVIFNDEKVALSQNPPFTRATMYFYQRV